MVTIDVLKGTTVPEDWTLLRIPCTHTILASKRRLMVEEVLWVCDDAVVSHYAVNSDNNKGIVVFLASVVLIEQLLTGKQGQRGLARS